MAGDKGTKSSVLDKIYRQGIESAAVDLAPMLAEADPQAELARIEREAAEERRRREVEQSLKDSSKHLSQVIQEWSRRTAVEQSYTGASPWPWAAPSSLEIQSAVLVSAAPCMTPSDIVPSAEVN